MKTISRLWMAVLCLVSLSQAARVERIGISDADKLLQSWLAAQNKGDFAAYQTLYADRFTGIRRSGTRVVPMDRKRWLADREKMFRQPMQVGATDVSITPGDKTAVLQFTQSWESATYQDKGPKQIILIRDAKGELRITQEVMRESRIAFHDSSSAADNLSFAHVLLNVVVLPIQPQKDWAAAPASLLSRESTLAAAIASIKPDALPTGAARWKNHPVRLYSPTGLSCSGTIVDFKILFAMQPHFGQSQRWNGQSFDDADSSAKPMSNTEIAKDIVSSGDAYLVGQVRATKGDCSGAVWARSDALPAVTPLAPATDTSIRQLALSQFRTMPAYRKNAKEGGFASDGHWDNPDLTHIHIYKSQTGTYVAVGSESGGACSQEAFASLTAIGKVEGTAEKPRIHWLGSFDAAYSVEAAFDVPGESAPRLLYETFPANSGVLRLETGAYQSGNPLAIPYFDCPC